MNVQFITIDEDAAGQRLDNFLFTHMKGVPKTRIYKAVRTGEVRVNKGRVKPLYRLQLDDVVRLPPLRQAEQAPLAAPSSHRLANLEQRILYENERLLIIDKPAGIPVHGGTAVSYGVIEALRVLRPQCRFLELAHRLDKDTSGCLLVAKKRQMLLELQLALRERRVTKKYLALVQGVWKGGNRQVDVPLRKHVLEGGERMVKVDVQFGRKAVSVFRPLKHFSNATLMEVRIKTGRTHQIRVHAAHLGHPLAGDGKYGDKKFNLYMKKQGLNRIFLHSSEWFCYVGDKEPLGLCSLLDSELRYCLDRLNNL